MSHAGQLSDAFLFVTLPAEDERDVVRCAQGGDTAAFERLYRAHLRRVFALCLRMTADEGAAEELTQQAFIAAWRKLPSFRGECTLATWLHRLTVNVVMNGMRTDRRRTRRVETVPDVAAVETGRGAAPAGARLDLEQAIAGLPAQARIVFVLHEVEGWSHEEIALQLSVAAGTCRAQLHRARQLLQEALR